MVDFHIGVGFGAFPLSDSVLNQLRGGTEYSAILSPADQHLLDQPSVVVEMTPYYREQFHPAWTLAKVQSVTGKQVKVTGQLMIDNVHHIPKDDCGLGDAGHQQMLARVDVGSSSGHQFPGLQRGPLRRQFHELGKFGRDVAE